MEKDIIGASEILNRLHYGGNNMGQIVKKTLLGKELVFSESMDAFNSLRKKYLMLSAEARERAENAYKANINSYSSYMKNCRLLMGEIFEHYLQIGVLDIIKFGIFDIDEVAVSIYNMQMYAQERKEDAICKRNVRKFTASVLRH